MGIETILISDGDGWKNFKGDINIVYKNKSINIFSKILRHFEKYYTFKKIFNNINLRSTDIILIANPHFIPLYKFKDTINFLISKTKNIFLSAIGTDWIYVSYSSKLKYWPYMNDIFIKFKYFLLYKRRDLYLLRIIRRIIPSLYDYSMPYKLSPFQTKVSTTLPLPFDSKDIHIKKQKVNQKIIIFHGIIRRKFKGSEIIEKALNKIQLEFPNDLEIIVKGNMKFSEYEKFLDSIDILVDQCKSYSYGMNTLYALSKGKIVLTGFHKLSKKDLNVNFDTPFLIGISPSEHKIYEELKKIIITAKKDPKFLIKMNKLAKNYVNEIHSLQKISKLYLDTLNAKI